ncbi:MAG: hypothetical protein J6R40_04175, partial [Clostridia bacterium]|nr:hypothetical protein [Clostridia bacterium]
MKKLAFLALLVCALLLCLAACNPHKHMLQPTVRENEKAPSCTAVGSYDEVVYCTCGDEISRKTITYGAKLPHTESAPVCENVPSSICETVGSWDEVTYCSVCETELRRTAKRSAHAFQNGACIDCGASEGLVFVPNDYDTCYVEG